ncbi:caspase family protein [Labrys wisconsinensis]|uniref:Peptidase C14 caspase domain-containing protein n=1 Tax=Labrys wisconsinensis TaxID=425677 RepID=A0ABU0JE71_9HYPH|nr:caspase family protein [Labrys wisconsinensis]MDQ0472570.1 hypothetical protein [Labrys wisconsinensis]
MRRLSIGERLAGAAALALCLAAPVPALAARYALVVGIDAYDAPIPALHGAVNDARDIAGALARLGTERTILLTDKQVTKQAVVAAWESLLGEAKAGDTLIFTYAGHGSQEPARPGDPEEPDGLDENFPLANYGLDGPGLAERIVDNEVAEWLQQAAARKVHVVFVADACHSGTMYRSVSLGLTYRAAPKLKIDRTELLKFAPPAPEVSERIAPNDDVTFLAGVSDERLVPEVQIDGQPRGALSYAFARALEGAADADHDGVTTEKELVAFIRATVQQKTDSQQVPQSFPPVSRARSVFDTRAAPPQPVQPVAKQPDAPPVVVAAGDLPLLLAYRGGQGPAQVQGAAVVADEGAADLVYDLAARTVEKRVAGIVAENVAPDGLPGIVAKWRAIAMLKAATTSALPFEVASGPRTYRRGEKLAVALGQSPHPYMTLFNLPPNGKVEFLYPVSKAEHDQDWRGRSFALPLQVRDPPFGSEHLIAILSDQPLDELHAALKGLTSPQAAADLPDVLKNALSGQAVSVGIADVFTSGGG